jgi:3-dehydroquinate dehydratase
MAKVLIVHGAGMNMRGKAQLEVFGTMMLPEYDQCIRKYAPELSLEIEIFQFSEVARVTRGAVTGFGIFGYYLALRGVAELLKAQ